MGSQEELKSPVYKSYRYFDSLNYLNNGKQKKKKKKYCLISGEY